MNVLVLINKPEGYRSSQCVGIVKRKLNKIKVGHSGTLDSTASGLLVLLTGNAARFSEFVMSLPKVYRAEIQFGAETNTYDYSGEKISEIGYENFDGKILDDELFSFLGYRLQTPPAISAIKINGRAAYKFARSGIEVEMKARPVFFRDIKIISPYDKNNGTITLDIFCGRGTYIRSLAHDLGKISGCGAYIKSLKRISIGNFNLSDSNSIEDENLKLVTLSEFAKNFTRIYVSDRDEKTFTNGMSILIRQAEKISRGLTVMKDTVFVEGGKFLGVGAYAGQDYIKPLMIVSKIT